MKALQTLSGALCASLLVIMTNGTSTPVYGQAAKSPLTQSRQMIVVTTKDWQTVPGTLQRYARRTTRSAWQPVGKPVPIVVGRSGLAWGAGLHGEPATLAQGNDPLKQEGDGKSPAGAFRLNAAFGYAPKGKAGQLKMPYVASTATMQCVDDAQSAYYNRVVNRADLKQPDWQSHEDMLRKDELYRWGVVVEHNAGGVGQSSVKAKPRGGSCIFLHIWGGPKSSTSGCTAMEASLMEEVLRWLDARQQPVLVQLLVSEYARLKGAWRLP
ncbi:MAG: L,D-transpeptidase family protein [Acidobacteria bacterium]|nr:L,D-transpeptidase family protein [Acidobacteriota bacterium]MBI3428181.1 L,D-transpeptidase family protein [Acidobacteriota bacterium]